MSEAPQPNQPIALVTGSSRGIGAAIVRHLSRLGMRCFINYIEEGGGKNLADAQQVAAQTKAAGIFQCDVANPDQVRAMMQAIARQAGGLNILVNNAAIVRNRWIHETTQEDWEDMLRINLTGPFNCIQSSLPILRPGGRIVNIASITAYKAFAGCGNYAAAKAGLIALTRTAANELASRQITVNGVAPGLVATEMLKATSPKEQAEVLKQIPLGRFATVDDIAQTVVFLCSSAADYITGEIIHVNGGWLMD